MIMSEVIKTAEGEYVFLDTRDTSDAGWETMGFLCDSEGHVISWQELLVERYNTQAQAMAGHTRIKLYLETGL